MTDSLSESPRRGQHWDDKQPKQVSEILPFDLHAEADHVQPHVVDMSVMPDDDDDFDHDGDTQVDPDDDPPPAPVSAALVIRAPRGPQSVRPGFTIAAVTFERDGETGEEEVREFQFLTRDKLQTRFVAEGVANFKALRPNRLPFAATHIVVNDETGREVYRRELCRAA